MSDVADLGIFSRKKMNPVAVVTGFLNINETLITTDRDFKHLAYPQLVEVEFVEKNN